MNLAVCFDEGIPPLDDLGLKVGDSCLHSARKLANAPVVESPSLKEHSCGRRGWQNGHVEGAILHSTWIANLHATTTIGRICDEAAQNFALVFAGAVGAIPLNVKAGWLVLNR